MKFLATCLLFAASLLADPLIEILPDPANPAGSGPAGTPVGWGFKVTGDPVYWVSITSAFVLTETNPSLGFFFDLIGPQGGPVGGALGPGNIWQQDFNPNPATWAGLGFYAITNMSAPAGATTSGQIRVQYERFSGNPITCGGCQIAEDPQFQDLNFSVTVSPQNIDAVPEPSTWAMLASGLGAMIWCGRRRMAPTPTKSRPAPDAPSQHPD